MHEKLRSFSLACANSFVHADLEEILRIILSFLGDCQLLTVFVWRLINADLPSIRIRRLSAPGRYRLTSQKTVNDCYGERPFSNQTKNSVILHIAKIPKYTKTLNLVCTVSYKEFLGFKTIHDKFGGAEWKRDLALPQIHGHSARWLLPLQKLSG